MYVLFISVSLHCHLEGLIKLNLLLKCCDCDENAESKFAVTAIMDIVTAVLLYYRC